MTDEAIYTLYISDDAYDELVLQARMMSYVHGTETAKGLSAYIAFLVTCDHHVCGAESSCQPTPS
jgi:hypothetical protein